MFFCYLVDQYWSWIQWNILLYSIFLHLINGQMNMSILWYILERKESSWRVIAFSIGGISIRIFQLKIARTGVLQPAVVGRFMVDKGHFINWELAFIILLTRLFLAYSCGLAAVTSINWRFKGVKLRHLDWIPAFGQILIPQEMFNDSYLTRNNSSTRFHFEN